MKEDMYFDDFNAYALAVEQGKSAEERNELAKRVIMDLEMLKKIKLNANELAYKMIKHLFDNTMIGLLGIDVNDDIADSICINCSYWEEEKNEPESAW